MKNLCILMLLIIGSIQVTSAQCPPSTTPGIHIVQPEENLYRISLAYGVPMGEICKWNNMTVDDVLSACKELKVAAPSVKSQGTTPTNYSTDEFNDKSGTVAGNAYQMQGKKHTVKSGETLAGLAELYGFTEKKFRSINAMPDDRTLTPGSILLTTECSCEVVNQDVHTAKTTATSPKFRGAFDNVSKPAPSVPSPIKSDISPASHTTPHKNLSSRSNDVITTKGGNAIAAPYMKQVEYTMLEEINLMRGNPSGYIKYVEQYRKDKKKAGYPVPDATVDELIEELRNTPRLSTLQPSECIYNAARNHGQDILSKGKSGHQGSDGSWPWDRVKRSCTSFQDGNENLVGGPATVRESVILLLIDHGISSRGHRKTLLNPHWTHGASYKIGQVGQMPNTWVQKFGQLGKSSVSTGSTTSGTKPVIHIAH